MARVYPHVFTLPINPDGNDTDLVDLRDRLLALEALGSVSRRFEELFDCSIYLHVCLCFADTSIWNESALSQLSLCFDRDHSDRHSPMRE
jgi:hypothetical protein